MPVIAAQNLHKSYAERHILSGVDVVIRSNERVGIVGSNGAGKSTLARIIAGIETPDVGNVARRRGAQILYLEQVPKFEGDPTAHEAVALGLRAWSDAVERHASASRALAAASGDVSSLLSEQEAAAHDVERLGGWNREHQVDAILGHLGVLQPEARISTLSGGEQRRVALARILIARPHLAILDEPTNHLDAETIEWLENYLLEEYVGAVALITHDRYLLDRVAERTLELDAGQLYAYDGGYELYLEQKAERLAHAARTEANRQNFLRRELEWLRRQPKARTTKQKARIERAEAAKSAIAPQAEQTAEFKLDAVRTGKTILELRKLCIELAGRRLVSNLDLFLTQGERIGIVGRNGTGKTTLLRAVLGELGPSAGEVLLGANTKVAYFDQQRSGLNDDKSIFDNVIGDNPRIELGGQVIEPYAYLERFLFDRYKQRQPVGSLSGGERARVALAKMLRQSANLVILDEPTNDLDVAALGALESMLVEFGGTALVVTHDRWFLDRVATSILAFEGDGTVVHYPGNYTTFRRLKAEAAPAELPEKPAKPAAEPKAQPKQNKKKPLTFAEERELSGLLDQIEGAETRVHELTAKLSDPATYGAGGDVRALNAELEAARAEAERLTLRWEELETKRASGSSQ